MTPPDDTNHPTETDILGNMTRRTYLTIKACGGVFPVSLFVAVEAVSTTAMAHPEWDMDEVRTWVEWETS